MAFIIACLNSAAAYYQFLQQSFQCMFTYISNFILTKAYNVSRTDVEMDSN